MGVIRLDSRLWDPDWAWRTTYLRWLRFVTIMKGQMGYTYGWLHGYSYTW